LCDWPILGWLHHWQKTIVVACFHNRLSTPGLLATVDSDDLQFYSLYVSRFAGGFGFSALALLLPKYANALDASGIMLGLFFTGFTATQALVTVPLAWAGDRYDKRAIFIGLLGFGVVVSIAFTLVESSWQLVAVRGGQGILATGMGLLSLSLVGELATAETRANHIGKANAWRFAASLLGFAAAGVLYDRYGFEPVFYVLAVLFVVAFVAVWLLLDPDDTRIEGFPFGDLAFDSQILTLTSFRAQYAVAVTLVRSWVSVFAGLAVAQGGLAYSGTVVAVVLSAEKFTNMLCQPYTGRLSDRFGRSLFVAVGGAAYGIVALTVPLTPALGSALGAPDVVPILGALSPAFFPLIAVNGLLGVADAFREPASMALFADVGIDGEGVASSFGVRELVWRPGSVLAPVLGGYLMAEFGMAWAFYVGGAFALTGVVTFVAILVRSHGAAALTEW
jgi:MFS family permease